MKGEYRSYVDKLSDNFWRINVRYKVMDGQPVSFDDVSTVEHRRSYMPNRVINQPGVPAPTLAMRANAPVFGTKDQLHEDHVGGHSKQFLYSPYATAFNVRVQASDHPRYSTDSLASSQSITAPENDPTDERAPGSGKTRRLRALGPRPHHAPVAQNPRAEDGLAHAVSIGRRGSLSG